MENKDEKKPKKNYDVINKRTYRAVVWLERAEFWFTIGIVATIVYAVILFGLGDLSDKPNMKGLASIIGFLVMGSWCVCAFSTLVHISNRFGIEAKPSLTTPLGLLIFSVMSVVGLALYISTALLK